MNASRTLREVMCGHSLEEYPYAWFWRARLPERKGQPCRVLVRGAKNSVLVQFADGHTVVTSRYAVRLRNKETRGGKT